MVAEYWDAEMMVGSLQVLDGCKAFLQWVNIAWLRKTPVSFFDAIRMLYVSFDAIRMLYALCNMYVSFDAIRMLYALCDTPVSCFMRKVCSMRRAWLWGIYRMFCFCEELSKSTIYWLDQSTVIDYPTICFALTHRIYHLCSSSNHLSPAT